MGDRGDVRSDVRRKRWVDSGDVRRNRWVDKGVVEGQWIEVM